MKRKMAVIVRPPASNAKLEELRAAVESLRREGHRISVRLTFESGDARRFARAAARAGWDAVVAAGGDGTINEVVNGLAGANPHAALGILPLGTANDFARSVGVPETIEGALRLAATGTPHPVDIARVNRRCFINVSTGGFGVRTSQSAGRGVKKYLGGLAYVVRGARNMLDFEVRRGVFRVNGDVVHEGEFVFFAVGNARQTGGGTPLTPLANVGDGRLDVMLVRGVSRLQFVSLLPHLRRGTHLESAYVSYFRGDEFEVATDERVPVNADGEAIAGETYRYDVLAEPRLVITGRGAEEMLR